MPPDPFDGVHEVPRSSPPVLRLGRLIADLELIDRDIDERYFEIAALAAVHL